MKVLSAVRSNLFSGDNSRAIGAMVLDVLVVALAYAAALLLRFDAEVPRQNSEFVLAIFPVIAAVYVVMNLVFGVYRTVWSYGSLGDILALLRPVLLATLLIFGVNFWVNERDLPLSVILIAGELIFPGMAFVKMRARLLLRLPRAAQLVADVERVAPAVAAHGGEGDLRVGLDALPAGGVIGIERIDRPRRDGGKQEGEQGSGTQESHRQAIDCKGRGRRAVTQGRTLAAAA